ncbi:hypothetical protein FRC07_008420 [Ceratobasidium sp. 392]|nr:hypothetical protein FRC07_008420 [Ceratobasidium sp. 392]
MLRSFSAITRLDWELEESCDKAILELAEFPLPCPRLEHLRVHGVPSDELLEVVRLRIDRGASLRIVEVNSRDWGLIENNAKEYLEGVLEKFGQYVDENESDSDDEDSDWTDTDGDNDSNGSTSDSTGSEATGVDLDNLETMKLANDFKHIDVEYSTWEALVERDLLQLTMFEKLPPLLKSLGLVSVPGSFFFANPNIPLVSNLTHLELGTAPGPAPLPGLYELLVHSPQLEYLILDMRQVVRIIHGAGFQGKRVNLLYLRRFALRDSMTTAWALAVLTMIDAPGVEYFTLTLSNIKLPYQPGTVAIKCDYMADTVSLNEPDSDDIGPLYSAVKHLTIGTFPDESYYMGVMARQFKTITRLDWELGEHYLRVYGVPGDELSDVISTRIKDDMHLKVLEVNSRDWDFIKDSTKEYLEEAVEQFGQYVDDGTDAMDSD